MNYLLGRLGRLEKAASRTDTVLIHWEWPEDVPVVICDGRRYERLPDESVDVLLERIGSDVGAGVHWLAAAMS